MIIDVLSEQGNVFYIIGQVRNYIKNQDGPDVEERLEAVTKLMYESDYEICLRIAVQETNGTLEFHKNNEPYVVQDEEENVWLFGDPIDVKEDLDYEIVFTPDFEVNINDDSDK